jgi:hypothetical protein
VAFAFLNDCFVLNNKGNVVMTFAIQGRLLSRPTHPKYLSQYLLAQIRALELEMDSTPSGKNEHVEYFMQKYIRQCITVQWDKKNVIREKKTISARHLDPATAMRSGFIFNQDQSLQQDVLVYTVPCTGVVDLFWLAPSSNVLGSMPKLDINGNSIQFEIALYEHQPDITKKEIEYCINCINTHISHLNTDLRHHNDALNGIITRLSEKKILKEEKLSALLDNLDITIQQNPTEPTPAASLLPRKINDSDYFYIGLSYGGKDLSAAEKLNNLLKKNGINTWFYPDDGLPGVKLHRMMSDMISKVDRVILLCSKTSMTRMGVLNELEITLEREASEGGSTRLIPIALDNYVLNEWSPDRPDLATRVRGRNIFEINVEEFESEITQKQLAQLLLALKK